MKIAHVVCSFPPYRGGIGNSALQMAKSVLAYGHSVTVMTPDYGQDRRRDAEPELGAVTVKRLATYGAYGNAAWLPQLSWQLRDYDIVHFHYPFYGAALAVLLAKLCRPSLKLILHYHMDNRAPGWKGLVFKLYKKVFFPILFHSADFVTCASLDYVNHSDIAKYLTARPQKFAQVPFGVDSNLFQTGARPSASRQLLFVGGLDAAHYFKGVDVLIEALALVNKKTTDWSLKIVGRGELKERYVALVRSLGLAQKVEFVSNASNLDLVAAYQASRVLILPSINRNEAFGLVLLEAMACGRPVIASNLPGVRSVFTNNQEGLVVRPGSARDLADKISKVLTDDELVDRLGVAGAQLTRDHYNWQQAGNKLNELYHRVKYTPIKL
jgi:glycosyltransferase involved in cell wall biosynthesis